MEKQTNLDDLGHKGLADSPEKLASTIGIAVLIVVLNITLSLQGLLGRTEMTQDHSPL